MPETDKIFLAYEGVEGMTVEEMEPYVEAH
jgi:hypothetical protein